jgi:hypothetical protein
MIKPTRIQSAILVNLLQWDSESSLYKIDDNVAICQTESSEIERLYYELCKNDGIDQGDPLTFPSHILISDTSSDDYDWNNPTSAFSKCCNMITICLSNPIRMCRLITSGDDFQTSLSPSIIIYEDYEELQSLRPRGDWGVLDDKILSEIKTCWQNYEVIINSRELNPHRVENAFSYFFYAWRSHNLKHICLNLSIVLETLFSPSSSNELSHQIAFNLSRFLGENKEQRESAYNTIKIFYRLRSSIVHGGKTDINDLDNIFPDVFHLCARILKSLLMDYKCANKFCDDKLRKILFNDWLFT